MRMGVSCWLWFAVCACCSTDMLRDAAGACCCAALHGSAGAGGREDQRQDSAGILGRMLQAARLVAEAFASCQDADHYTSFEGIAPYNNIPTLTMLKYELFKFSTAPLFEQ